ncbi:MAG: ubiquinone/menaquinone biosynthesis methyltransferase [Planctomycetota bacterium]
MSAILSQANRQRVAVPAGADQHTIRRMFAEVAPRYDFLNHLLSLEQDHLWRRCLVRSALARGGVARVLDLCTGTGDLALAFARRLPADARVLGLDFCGAMVERARHKLLGLCLPSVSFGLGDATSLPIRSRQFDVVSVAFGIRNVADRAAAIAEVHRVLRPGGSFHVLEFSMPRLPLIRHVYAFYFARILPWIGRVVARTRLDAYAYLPASVGQFPDPPAFARELERGGFGPVTRRSLSMGTVSLYQAIAG